MPCLDEMALVSLASGGELSAEAEAHLAGCADCRTLVAALVKGQQRTAPLTHPDEAIASVVSLKPGDQVGRYEVIALIGAGGMGVVYSARDPKLDRNVALKVVGRSRSDAAYKRLLREAQAMARLSHPNVVTVHDVIAQDPDVVVAMELVPGETLEDWLGKPRSWHDIVDVFIQAARGLSAAHRVGLVHRDFKPANVFVRDDGRVQVGDFGLARLSSDSSNPDTPLGTQMTQPGTMIGTPRYMAPEVHRGEAADDRSDQFSFSVALLEALFDLPEDGRAPKAVDDIVTRGLLPDAKARHPSMSAIVEALERTRLPSTPTLTQLPKQRKTRLVIVAFAAVAVAVGGIAIWRSSKSSEPSKPHVVTDADRTRAAAKLVNAKEQFAKGLPGQASDVLAEALALDPKLNAARYYRARALHEKGSEREARAELERALKDPLPEREQLLANALRLEINGRFVDAEASLQQAAAKFPNDAHVRFDLGDWAFHVGRFDAAERELRAVVKLDPQFSLAHQHLVWSLDNLARPRDAVVAAQEWRAASKNKESTMLLLESMYIAGDFDEAAKLITELQGMAPSSELGFARADLLIVKGDIAEARKQMEVYNTLDTNYDDQRGARWSLVWLEGRAWRFRRIAELVDAERNASKPDKHILQTVEMIERLLLAARGQVVKIPDDIEAREAGSVILASQALVEAGEFDRAKKLLESDGSPDPFARALVDAEQFRRSGRFEEAAKLFETATHGFRNARILGHYGLARCYYALERYADAIRASDPVAKSHAFRPRGFHAFVYPQALLLQARAHEKLGDRVEARRKFQELAAVWSDADKDLPEVQEVTLALERLR